MSQKMRRQDLWDEENGYMSKSYKIKKVLVNQFAVACEKREVSLTSQISKMMKEFVEETDKMEPNHKKEI